MTGQQMRSRLAGLLALPFAATLAGPAAAYAVKTTIDRVTQGEVCFTDAACVPVGVAYGALAEAPFRTSEWIVEIRDASGRAVVRTGKGGQIIVLSPTVYAKRDPGRSTYVIGRIGDRARPVQTNAVAIASPAVRTGWGRWAGPVAASFAMTALPREISDPTFRSTFRDRWRVEGDVQGVSPDGQLTDVFSEAIGVQKHGDYFIISHAGGATHSIADANMRRLSGRTDAIRAFSVPEPPHNPAEASLGPIAPRLIWATRVGTLGNSAPLYQLLPRRRGEAPPDGMLGVVPMLSGGFNLGWGCPELLRNSCTPGLPAWGAVWAGADGPEVSLLNVDGEPHDDQRYKSLVWTGRYSIDAGVLEERNGQVRLVTYRVDRALTPRLAISSEAYPSRAAAEAALERIGKAQSDAFWARWAAEEAAKQRAQAERYAAWQAARAAEERARADRAAQEAADLATADRLIATGDRSAICQGWSGVRSFYAQGKLSEACARLSPSPAATGTFLGNLAAGLAAYNAGRLGRLPSGSTPVGSGPSAGVGSGDFERRMQSIDTSLRVISDPNWNGAAAAAFRR